MMIDLAPNVIGILIVTICRTKAYDIFTYGDLQYIKPDPSGISISWDDAQQWCRKINASLAILDSVDRQKGLAEALKQFGLDSSDVWLSGKATYGDYWNWKWLDGDSYTSVVRNQGAYSKSYAYIMISPPLGSKEAEAGVATDSYPYICQYDKTASSCTSVERSNKFTSGDNCYVIYKEELPWFSARNNCLSKDGDLAIIKDFSSLQIPHDAVGSTSYWVGLRSSWWNWITGNSSMDIKFTQWAGGDQSQPNGPAAQCIAINGRAFPYWKDWDCTTQSTRFVCQAATFVTTASTKSIVASTSSSIKITPATTQPTSSSSSLARPTDQILSTSATPTDQILSTSSSTVIMAPSNATGTNRDFSLAVGLGVGLGVLFILGVAAAAVTVFLVRRQRNNANGETRTRFTDKTRDSMDMETLDTEILTSNRKTQMISQPQIPAESHYSEVERVTNSGAKVQPVPGPAPVYADLNFDQHDFR